MPGTVLDTRAPSTGDPLVMPWNLHPQFREHEDPQWSVGEWSNVLNLWHPISWWVWSRGRGLVLTNINVMVKSLWTFVACPRLRVCHPTRHEDNQSWFSFCRSTRCCARLMPCRFRTAQRSRLLGNWRRFSHRYGGWTILNVREDGCIQLVGTLFLSVKVNFPDHRRYSRLNLTSRTVRSNGW